MSNRIDIKDDPLHREIEITQATVKRVHEGGKFVDLEAADPITGRPMLFLRVPHDQSSTADGSFHLLDDDGDADNV